MMKAWLFGIVCLLAALASSPGLAEKKSPDHLEATVALKKPGSDQVIVVRAKRIPAKGFLSGAIVGDTGKGEGLVSVSFDALSRIEQGDNAADWSFYPKENTEWGETVYRLTRASVSAMDETYEPRFKRMAFPECEQGGMVGFLYHNETFDEDQWYFVCAEHIKYLEFK